MPRAAQPVAVCRPDGAVVCENCAIADTVLARLCGLLGRRALEDREGLLIRPAASVHMFGMRFAVDVVFLDRRMVVVKVVAGLRPWRVAGCRGARDALELPAGAAARRGVVTGERLALLEAPARG